MIFQSKQKVNDAPVWEVDTDTQTIRHRNPKTGETERYVFHTDHIRYYLHHIEEKRPDLLQEIVDKGEIYKHLDELDTKVTDAVNRQTELSSERSPRLCAYSDIAACRISSGSTPYSAITFFAILASFILPRSIAS